MATEPSMIHFPQIKDTPLTKLVDGGGSNSFMKAVAYSQVDGKEMQAGLLRLEAGSPLEYTHLYEGIVLVISGEFNITDGAGQTFTAKPGDSMHIPRGTKVTYSTDATSLMYYVMHPPGAEEATEIQSAIGSNPKIVRAENTATVDIGKFDNEFKSVSYLQDFLVSDVKGKEMAGGFYRLFKGPSHDYKYEYEEFKYIVEGTLHLTDGTGKFVAAKAGDLMYFPKDSFIKFDTPDHGLGFFVGQRESGTA